jgi:purine-cytosine permease-like protein
LRYIKFAGFNVRVPAHPILRIALGGILVFGGFLGFLPVLGFWMLPLGLVILSIDFALVRRFRRKATVRLGRYMLQRWPNLARRIGFGI